MRSLYREAGSACGYTPLAAISKIRVHCISAGLQTGGVNLGRSTRTGNTHTAAAPLVLNRAMRIEIRPIRTCVHRLPGEDLSWLDRTSCAGWHRRRSAAEREVQAGL